jgi:hypothetical protein
MKRISRIFYSALLLLVGTAFAQNTALCINALTATPSTLTFNVTSSPSVAQTYTLTNHASSESVNVTVTASEHTQVQSGPNGEWKTSLGLGLAPGESRDVNVRVFTDYTIATLNEVVTNNGYSIPYADLEVNAPIQISGQAPLPIQLASFKAVTLARNGVKLTWTTASEMNNYGFYVQRNGVDLTFIGGYGTSLQSHTYSYTDNPLPGKYRYTLKQVDLDGRASLSESVDIEVAAPVKFALNQNYPNPFNPTTKIAFSITKQGPVSLRVYDILGREVATLVNENRKAGQYTESFSGNQMASGVYVYVLRSSEGQLVGRMMMMK